MTTHERLEAMELIWSALCHDSEVDSPAWHESELNTRMQKIESGKAKFYSLDEVRKHFS